MKRTFSRTILRRAVMTLLLAVMTMTAWADPTIIVEPEGATSVEVKNGTQIYITHYNGWRVKSVTWYENEPYVGDGGIVPCEDSYMGYYIAPNSGGYVVVRLEVTLPFAISKSEGSGVYDVLTISGSDAMFNCSIQEDSPWWPYHETIKTIVINEGVTFVGNNAFKDFTALNSVSLPSTVTRIGNSAFKGCTSLTSIEFPSTLTTIEPYAFRLCSRLTSIDIPASVTSIDYWAFYECTRLASVTVRATTPPALGYFPFDYNATGRKICVFSDCLSIYQTNWSKYASSIEPLMVTANDAGGSWGRWGTYYSGLADVTVSDGTTIYKAAVTADVLTLTPVAGNIVKRGEAVLLNTTSETITLASAASSGTGDFSGNELTGADVSTAKADGYTYYVLSKKNGNFGFFEYTGANLPANKAYLKLSNSNAPRSFDIAFDESTGIQAIDHSPLTIDHSSGAWYTLDGRKLQGKPTVKSVYIVNGKKRVIK